MVDRIIGELEQADGDDQAPTGWNRLEPEELPPAPFKLRPCVTITDATRWLDSIRLEVDAGTLGPRARMGSLQDDLRDLAPLLVS
jgi:hypothetical protein